MPAILSRMSIEKLNRFLSAANDFDASDLHLITGVPPAYQIRGVAE